MNTLEGLYLSALKKSYYPLSDAVIIVDSKNTIVFVNPAWEKLTRLQSPSVIGKNIDEIYNQLKLKLPKKIKSTVIQEGIFIKKPISWQMKSKNIPLYITFYTVISDNEKYAIHMYRKSSRGQQKIHILEKSEEQYRLLFENSPHVMWIIDQEKFRFLMVNNAAIQQYGYSKKEFLSMTVFDIRPPHEIGKLRNHLQSISPSNNSGVQMQGVWTHRKKDGTDISVEISSTSILFNNQKAFLIHVTDISEKKLVEEAAAELQRKIIHILDSITDAFISCDENWKITYINKRAIRFLSINQQNVIGKSLWKVIDPDAAALVKKQFLSASKHEQSFRFDVKWDHGRWLRFHLYPSYRGLSVYINDITTDKEKSLRKDDFISIASHELKTPVTSIKAYSQLLTREIQKTGDEKQLKLISKMEEQIERINQLIADLLDVGRIQTGRLKMNKESVDLEELIKKTIRHVKSQAKNHTFSLKGTLTHAVMVDKRAITEVMTNLLTNAIKYSPDGKKILISLSEKKHQVLVSVEDFGVGIPPELQDKIFARFYRVNQNNSTKYQGLGLGLYITKEIIKQHGGEITVRSEVGKGSIFTFSLPLKES